MRVDVVDWLEARWIEQGPSLWAWISMERYVRVNYRAACKMTRFMIAIPAS